MTGTAGCSSEGSRRILCRKHNIAHEPLALRTLYVAFAENAVANNHIVHAVAFRTKLFP